MENFSEITHSCSASSSSQDPGAALPETMSRTLTVRSQRKVAVSPADVLLIPILRYRDPAAAIEWLCRAFGVNYHVAADHRVVYAQLRLGGALIFRGPDCADVKYGVYSPSSPMGASQYLYIVTNRDVDAHCAQARQAGADILTEPYSTPYGGREYCCRDPEGHVWSIGSYRGEP